MSAENILNLFMGITGLSVDDLVEAATADTPEQKEELETRNLIKMFDHVEETK